jgi:hypothetical protein
MRILILSILFILSAGAKGQTSGILGPVSTSIDFNTLVDGGTFTPATSLTANVQQYRDYDYGWLIHYGINTYNGHWADQRTQVPPPPSAFNPTSVNVAAWADSALAHGLDYAGLTVINEYGFLLYNSQVAYNMERIALGAGYSPYYEAPYCVQPGYDTAILSKFVTEFSSRGIEPMFYFGYGGNMNLFQYSTGVMWDIADAGREELVIQYYCKVAQELARKWPRVKYYWVDLAATGFPTGAIQRLYNAFKSINPDIVVIGNALGESDFARFPYDIGSVEEYIAYGNPSYVSGNTLSHVGTTYHIPREIVGTPYSDYSQWYYYDELCPDQPVNNPFTGVPPYVKMQAVSTATFQGLVDVARGANRPFLAVMMVDRDGNLVQATKDYYRHIDFQPPD